MVFRNGATWIGEEQMLGLAEMLLASRDFAESKNLVHAFQSDPLLANNAQQVIAVADALLSSQILIKNHITSYAVLQLDPYCCDASTIRNHYTRLTGRLRAAQDHLPFAAKALRIVSDAWEVLSDPSKKSLLDAVLNAQKEENASSPTFWTSCHSCRNLFQYELAYLGRMLWCSNCRQAFTATELAAPPAMVPGTNMYYCSWVATPLGHRTGSAGGELNPFYRARPLAPTCTTAATGGEASQTSTPPSTAKDLKNGSFGELGDEPESSPGLAMNRRALRAVIKFEDCEGGTKANLVLIDSEEEEED